MTQCHLASLSFRAEQSGVEKSPTTHDTNNNTAGDLSTLRQQYRVHLSPYRHVSPLEMTIAAGSFIVIPGKSADDTIPSRTIVISRVGSGGPKSPSSYDTTVPPPLCHFERNAVESRNLLPHMTPLYFNTAAGNFSHTVSYPACHLCFSHLFTSPPAY